MLRPVIRDADLTGLKFFKQLRSLPDSSHEINAARDKSGNRKLHPDQDCVKNSDFRCPRMGYHPSIVPAKHPQRSLWAQPPLDTIRSLGRLLAKIYERGWVV